MSRAARWALARMAATGNAEACSAALTGVDPLLRWRAGRTARTALLQAERATSLSDPAHLARLASLFLARGLPDAGFDDAEAVRAEYAALPEATAPRRGPWLSAALALLIVALPPTGYATWRLTRPFTPSSLPGGALLGDALVDYVVLLGARNPEATRAPLEALKARARGKEGLVAGPEGPARLARLLDAADAVNRVPAAGDPSAAPATEAFFAAAKEVSAGLAQQGSPFFVDPDLQDGARDRSLARQLLHRSRIDRPRVRYSAPRRARVAPRPSESAPALPRLHAGELGSRARAARSDRERPRALRVARAA